MIKFESFHQKDSIDLFLGNYRVEENPLGYSPYAEAAASASRNTWLSFLPGAFVISMVLLHGIRRIIRILKVSRHNVLSSMQVLAAATVLLAQDLSSSSPSLLFLLFW